MARFEYPIDFIRDVELEFSTEPEYASMRRFIDAGDLYPLGKLLHTARAFNGTPAHIHQMLYSGQHKELEREAAKADRRERIYARWYALNEAVKKA